MAETLYRDTTYQVSMLVESIRMGKIALPDIQRPFVWKAPKVRELFDSMYQGFPVGYLLFWETDADPGARQIGEADSAVVPNLLIVDGQQRLTSLFAVITGTPVLRADFTQARIRIAFRPADATFEVTDAAIEKNPEFIPDVSELWKPGGKRSVTRAYLSGLKKALTDEESDRLEEAIDRVYDLQHYPFKVVELSSRVDEERVAEIFVRINSQGVTLKQADFILTLMSVFWEKGRRDLEDFCRTAVNPSAGQASPFNWHITPQPAQLLRVSVAVAFRRAVLKHVYTLLRGKLLSPGGSIADQRGAQFDRLAAAQDHVLNLLHWQEFMHCLDRAGFLSRRMITNESAVLFSYSLWLIGRVDFGMPVDRLRELIARWFFMAHMTGRYSGSLETQVERDLAQLPDTGAPDEFTAVLTRLIDDAITPDFWRITLPNMLDNAAASSPALSAYLASQCILDAKVLLSTVSVRTQLQPGVNKKKGVERHHLFP